MYWQHNHMGTGGLLFMLFWAVVLIAPFWKISTRAGYSGWLSLLLLIPLINLGYLYFLAFAPWPRDNRENGAQ